MTWGTIRLSISQSINLISYNTLEPEMRDVDICPHRFILRMKYSPLLDIETVETLLISHCGPLSELRRKPIEHIFQVIKTSLEMRELKIRFLGSNTIAILFCCSGGTWRVEGQETRPEYPRCNVEPSC